MRAILFLLAALFLVSAPVPARAEPMTAEQMAEHVMPPYSVGKPLNDKGVHELLNSGGALAGYVFETEPLAPLPGFGGAPIDLLVVLDLEGRFIDVRLIEQNEPIFVSGLGEAPFRKFLQQYRGLSISDSIVVGTPYGAGGAGSLTYLDGVTKATASVRIAHESIMGAALAVAREKMKGIQTEPPAYPDPAHDEPLTWDDLVDQGIATRKVVTNAEIDAQFAGTLWEDDDPEARDAPDAAFLDLWVVDLGPPAIARAALSDEGLQELQGFLALSPDEEPILLIEIGRHGLVSPDFVRNTAPDWLTAEQNGLPVALRDSDLLVGLSGALPPELQDGVAMILRTDRRLGFDPASDWTLKVLAVREHGMFQPQAGSVTIEVPHATPGRFFLRPGKVQAAPPWLDALRSRRGDLIVLAAFLVGLTALLAFAMNPLADHKGFTPARLAILAFVTVFIGWWGQGQLSIVTVLGTIRTAYQGGSFGFLLYDPFSLMIWGFAILGFVLWGRGYFCGWLCPFGALQEFAHHLGRLLRLPQFDLPAKWDARLKGVKYLALAGLVATVFLSPDNVDKAVEIEPFKTAITTLFVRDWYYVLYAGFWLASGLVFFKGFCRHVCPLGAAMAIGSLLRGRKWIARRAECGTPCQLCRVKCNYRAIRPGGSIQYSECFACLDCVTIHNSSSRCVPLILAGRRRNGRQMEAAE